MMRSARLVWVMSCQFGSCLLRRRFPGRWVISFELRGLPGAEARRAPPLNSHLQLQD